MLTNIFFRKKYFRKRKRAGKTPSYKINWTNEEVKIYKILI
jgi:hypothetical protein